MNRIIKFRAWDNERKVMTESKDIINLCGNTSEQLKEDSPFWVLEQFTGLKDKNGKEIYEGDVVFDQMRGYEKRKSVVQWDIINPCFVLKRIDNKYNHIDYEYDFNKCDSMTIEVIGNIHQQ